MLVYFNYDPFLKRHREILNSDQVTSWEVSGPSHPDVRKPWMIFARIHDKTKLLHYFVTQEEAYGELDQLIDAIAQGSKKYSLPEDSSV
jgi:hypothetical protein